MSNPEQENNPEKQTAFPKSMQCGNAQCTNNPYLHSLTGLTGDVSPVPLGRDVPDQGPQSGQGGDASFKGKLRGGGARQGSFHNPACTLSMECRELRILIRFCDVSPIKV